MTIYEGIYPIKVDITIMVCINLGYTNNTFGWINFKIFALNFLKNLYGMNCFLDSEKKCFI